MKASRRKKKCRNCGEKFLPSRTTQVACNPICAIRAVEAARAKRETKARAEARAKLKPRSEHLREAQAAFNSFIRERDYGLGCISSGVGPIWSSGASPLGGTMDCGHYRSIGSCPELRFEELNAHAQSKHDNRHLSGNIVEYRKGLIERIGLEKVEWLEGNHEPKRYTIDELKQIKAKYRQKARELRREREQ